MASSKKGTLKIHEIRSNKGIFPLFIRFPYLKNSYKSVPKSPKMVSEILTLKMKVLFKIDGKADSFLTKSAYFQELFL